MISSITITLWQCWAPCESSPCATRCVNATEFESITEVNSLVTCSVMCAQCSPFPRNKEKELIESFSLLWDNEQSGICCATAGLAKLPSILYTSLLRYSTAGLAKLSSIYESGTVLTKSPNRERDAKKSMFWVSFYLIFMSHVICGKNTTTNTRKKHKLDVNT